MVSQSVIAEVLRDKGSPADIRTICELLNLAYTDYSRADIFKKCKSLEKYGIVDSRIVDKRVFFIISMGEEDGT